MSGVMPLISAIVPVRDGASYVTEAIASILAQTYAPLECIVVDDGSTDGTASVLRDFGDRITYVSTPPRGVAAARNRGASVARGEFLAFLDADDTWEPTKVARQMALFARRPDLGLAYCGVRLVDARGEHLRVVAAPEPGQVLRNILLQRGPGPALAQTGVIPRAVFAAIGGFDERLPRSEDSDLAWRIAVRYELAAVSDALATYRIRPGQRHLDISSYERAVEMILRTAFSSGLLPADLEGLERRARTNVALSTAYGYGIDQRRPMQALPHLAVAFRLSPLRCARGAAAALARRMRRTLSLETTRAP